MHHEPDIFDLLTGAPGPEPTREPEDSSEERSTDSSMAVPSIELVIERDLAVTLVGSDAGRRMRIKPHSAMTRGASALEETEVNELMQPFLADEIRRVASDRAHRPKVSKVSATTGQALALKGFCLRYAEFLRGHLGKHPNDDRVHRSRQRLEQAYRVIDQVNSALGTTLDDGRTLRQCEHEAIALIEDLEFTICSLETRARAAGQEETIGPILDLQVAVRACLSLCRPS